MMVGERDQKATLLAMSCTPNGRGADYQKKRNAVSLYLSTLSDEKRSAVAG
jgi:hypothetical protein